MFHLQGRGRWTIRDDASSMLVTPVCTSSATVSVWSLPPPPLPCLVRELCDPAARILLVNMASCLLSCKLDFSQAVLDTDQSNHFAFVEPRGWGRGRDEEPAQKLACSLITEPPPLPAPSHSTSFVAQSEQLWHLSHPRIRGLYGTVGTERICSPSLSHF